MPPQALTAKSTLTDRPADALAAPSSQRSKPSRRTSRVRWRFALGRAIRTLARPDWPRTRTSWRRQPRTGETRWRRRRIAPATSRPWDVAVPAIGCRRRHDAVTRPRSSRACEMGGSSKHFRVLAEIALPRVFASRSWDSGHDCFRVRLSGKPASVAPPGRPAAGFPATTMKRVGSRRRVRRWRVRSSVGGA